MAPSRLMDLHITQSLAFIHSSSNITLRQSSQQSRKPSLLIDSLV